MMEVWRRGAFCRLGAGDLDIDAILKGVRALDYRGWLVVEQDMIPVRKRRRMPPRSTRIATAPTSAPRL